MKRVSFIRNIGEIICIDENVTITVMDIKNSRVYLEICLPNKQEAYRAEALLKDNYSEPQPD